MAPSLQDLLTSGLGDILESGGLPTEEALYNRQAQAERESTFGRGLGISSVTRDALAKARVDAALAAQQAQLAALGQAAGVTQANANRSQQESQFGRSLDQQKKALGQQKDLANTQMLASGIGAGVGALGQLGGAAFGPEIRTGTRGLFGLQPLAQDLINSTPGGLTPGPVSQISTEGFSLGGNTGGLNLDLANFGGGGGADYPMPSVSPMDFSGFDSSFGALDLGSLYDTSFDPFQQQSWGWY